LEVVVPRDKQAPGHHAPWHRLSPWYKNRGKICTVGTNEIDTWLSELLCVSYKRAISIFFC